MAVSRQYVMIVREGALLTPVANPVAGTDSIYIRLTEDFTMQPTMEAATIPYGGGVAIPADQVCDHYRLDGQLRTKLYPQQAAFLLNWAAFRINGTQDQPWTTTEPAGDLASCSVYHAVRRSDGTFSLKRYGGVKVGAWTLEASRQAADGAALTLDLIGCQSFGHAQDGTTDPTATEFPAPIDTSFPSGPYTFSDTSTHVTVGVVRSGYESMRLNVQNVFDRRFFETPHLQVLPWLGRNTTLDMTLLYKATPDDRTAYEAQTSLPVSVGFVHGASSVTVNMHGVNKIRSLPFRTPNAEIYRQDLSVQSLYDLGVGSDLDVAVV